MHFLKYVLDTLPLFLEISRSLLTLDAQIRNSDTCLYIIVTKQNVKSRLVNNLSVSSNGTEFSSWSDLTSVNPSFLSMNKKYSSGIEFSNRSNYTSV